MDGTRFVVAGTGRAARALCGAFAGAGGRLVGVVSRSAVRAAAFARDFDLPALSDAVALPEADAILVLSEDAAVATRAGELALRARPGLVWTHMAGSLPPDVLAPAARAAGGGEILAFHPLAVLDGRPRDLTGVTVTLDGSEGAVARGWTWAAALGAQPVEILAGDRAAYHLAACLSAGHLAGVLAASRRVAEAAGLPEAVSDGLAHLAAEAVAAYRAEGGRSVTGPLARGDLGTVAAHLAWLRTWGEQDVRRLYDAAGLCALEAAVRATEEIEVRRAAVARRLARDLAGP